MVHHSWAPLVELGGSGSSERFIWHEECSSAAVAFGLGQGEMGQAVCTPPGYQAGQPLNKADRAGGMRLRWLTFENSKEQDEARTAAPPFSC